MSEKKEKYTAVVLAAGKRSEEQPEREPGWAEA